MSWLKKLSALSGTLLLLLQTAAAQQIPGATIGGYGELHYNDVTYNATGEQTPGELDFHRFILFAGYDFNDWISFRSELELEHTLVEDDEGGEVALEQAYVDLRLKPALGVRAGLVLVPVGLVNPAHEPPTFNGVERPNVERYIIPSTWRESGIGIYGKSGSGWSYEAYLMAGLNGSEITGESGIRGARQNGFESSTDNWALTGRLDYQAGLNLKVGGSYYFSDLSSNGVFGDALKGTSFHLFEGHAVYENSGFEARALLAYSTINNAGDFNTVYGNQAGESQYGGYVELGYDLLRLGDTATEQELILFGRTELYDTQNSMAGFVDNPVNERHEYTFGFTYKPAPRVAFKADYQLLKTAAVKDIQQFNLGVGYNF